jgi:hypothetical protein
LSVTKRGLSSRGYVRRSVSFSAISAGDGA